MTPAGSADLVDSGAARRQLVLIALVLVLVLACWFAASAVVPALKAAWEIGDGRSTWLTAVVQLGFVTGAVTSALLNLADRFRPHVLVGVSALVASASTATVALVVDSFGPAVVLRFVTGVALAGVYPPMLKVMASWFDRGRGFALGVLVGALTLGSAVPQLVNSFTAVPWRGVLLVSSGLALTGGLVALALVHSGPLASPAPPLNPRYAVQLFRERGPLLANLGYFGHMWELYAMWTWVPAYLTASFAEADVWDASRTAVGLTSFATIGLAGMVGCLVGGRLGDRLGRARVAGWAMRLSATCCIAAAVVFGLSPVWVVPVLLVWGAAVIADSGLFSTCVTQVVDRRYVGTALTVQTAVGFLLTVVTINAVPYVVEQAGWRTAVALLAIGPVAGAVAMAKLDTLMNAESGEVHA